MSKFIDFCKKFLDKKTLKFIAVGALNTVVGMGIMLILSALFNAFTPEFAAKHLFNLGATEYTASYLISSIINYVVGGIVSYFLNKYWTFKKKERSKTEVIKFIITIVVCYAIAYLCAKPLTEVVLKNADIANKWKEFIALIVGAFFYTVLNYFAQRFLVFAENAKNKTEQPESENKEADGAPENDAAADDEQNNEQENDDGNITD